MNTLKLLKITPMEKPEVIEIEHTLENLQNLVGGMIQVVYPWDEDLVGIICNDEGKMKGYQANRLLEDENGEPYDILCGTFLITGLSEDDFESLTDEMTEKYTEIFKYPEMFTRSVEDGCLYVTRLGKGEPPIKVF